APTARRVSSIASRLPGTNRLGFQPSLALSVRGSGPTVLVAGQNPDSGSKSNEYSHFQRNKCDR
ncbi:MAG: hypothetical protein ABW095_02920, partial [Candidatus Thiodiazotropha sp.]